ncbi:hypothetical protein [Knoellia koreensis]|uniref:Uncharacterized protein n=1 Tax=Knoellia koreensis TaxID=2730921 RepID=A0A849H7Z1_9MICO|nr:hypothetical protein [Knoellia sp. DB2414S]NNM45846.1 hypothetical protein [Knoellia sp. DB2414S]
MSPPLLVPATVVAAALGIGPAGWSSVEGRPLLFGVVLLVVLQRGVVLFIWWCFLR